MLVTAGLGRGYNYADSGTQTGAGHVRDGAAGDKAGEGVCVRVRGRLLLWTL